ncbi:MAG: hypothetical protein H6506_01445 [Calditrichaeota bacterium]|nr:hypothetical protein [Calditrichota bacterium]MCB9366446.1 hypothetical protein [Calditrichota bacterium]MCB9391296.1 hypothetical protein [Calditrichota bacterium]
MATHFSERPSPQSLDERWPADVPIRLCAILVEFQPDDQPGTTGDGTFNSGFPDTLRIDPLPHDREYFADHLLFLENYFGNASRGAVTFSAKDIYPTGTAEPYRLAHPMWHYNYNSDNDLLNDRLVELFAEAVSLADADVDFTAYDAVLVFHAGVGKDFNVGFDNTPFDIPSAYISGRDLANYVGTLPAGVTRGLILPESQNQIETLEFEIELSMNGVLVKLFGNWLGMPDLFNTETGASGIGRWGMMDQGSGNVNAIVPALPDAWSRLYMGWEEPLVVFPSGAGDTVQISRFSDAGTNIIKVPISGNEYYLLENRDADADSVGSVTVYDRDNREMQIDREGNLAVPEGFGVAVRASHYDFGIPGSGILIWHIDEQVIAQNIDENRVNANPERRGVDLVEADGSQDIGREYGFASSGSGTELGIQEDCWYRLNEAFRDANGGTSFVRFNDNTRPSARLFDHAFTFLEISDFSDVSAVMSCRIRGTLVEDGFPVSFADTSALWAVADLNQDHLREFYVQSHDSLFLVDSLGAQLLTVLPTGVRLQRSSSASVEPDDELVFIGEMFGVLRNPDSLASPTFVNVPAGVGFVERALYCETPSGEPRYVIDFSHGLGVFSADLELLGTGEDFGDTIIGLRYLELPPAKRIIGLSDTRIHALSVGDDLSSEWFLEVSSSFKPTVVIEADRTLIWDGAVGYIDAANGSVVCSPSNCLPPDIDWDGDGRMEGGGADGADYTRREDFALSANGSYAYHDLNFDGNPDVLEFVSTENTTGDIVTRELTAYDHETRRYADFPMAVYGDAELVRLNPGAFRYHLVTMTVEEGVARFTLSRFPISPDGTVDEIYKVGGPSDGMIIVGPARPEVHERDQFAYVWPNPAADIARIRLTLPYAANADVTIFDLAGRKVAELSGSSSAPGAFEIPWDTRSVESGVYIGRVDAKGSGQSVSAELKIAVVR